MAESSNHETRPGNVSEAAFREFQVEAEKDKAALEHFKHLTTLSTGLILVLAGFLETIFPQPVLKVLAGVSLAAFALSVLGSATAHSMVAGAFGQRGWEGSERRVYRWGLGLAHCGFLAGVFSLSLFALINLF